MTGSTEPWAQVREWIDDKPLWVHEALRRIADKGALHEEDHDALVHLCLDQKIEIAGTTVHEPPDDGVEATELGTDFYPTDEEPPSWALSSLEEPQGVNLLDPNAELTLEEEGITVVFGLNGSGKSGYARILARASGARGDRGRILPNVYEPDPPDNPSAIISLTNTTDGNEDNDEDNQDQDQIEWSGGSLEDPRIRRIAFFDEEVADFYLDQTHGPQYMPAILRTLSELADAHDTVRKRVDQAAARLPDEKDLDVEDRFSILSPLISQLIESRDVETLAAISLYGDGQLPSTQTLQNKVDELEEQEEDPDSLQSEIEALEAFLDEVQPLLASLTDGLIRTVERARQLYQSAKEASKVTAAEEFDETPLEEVGSETWRTLWKAAEQYSNEAAYPDAEFPNLDEGALCVLCQQPLSQDARGRFETFEEYTERVTEDHLDHAESLLSHLKDILPTSGGEGAAFEQNLETVSDLVERSEDDIQEAVSGWREKVASLRAALDDPGEPLPESADWTLFFEIQHRMEEHKARLEEIDQIEGRSPSLQSAEERLARARERDTLAAVLPQWKTELERREAIDLIDEKKKTTNTQSLTSMVNQLGDQVLTDTLQEAFEETMDDLGLDTIEPEFQSVGGEKGKRVHKVGLDSEREVDVSKVASEGEQRGVALATFLTELATDTGKAPLALDDPISSLDHRWSSQVAHRLVGEARKRQVIVLTHRVVFVRELESAAEELDVEFTTRVVDRKPEATGIIEEVPTWDLATVNSRISNLNGRLNTLYQERDEITDSELRRRIASIYSSLRDAWERAVEEVLFNRTVQRYTPKVQTRRLEDVLKVKQSDIELIEKEMTRCSDLTEAHSKPLPKGPKARDLDDVRSDIRTLKEWAKDYRKRENS